MPSRSRALFRFAVLAVAAAVVTAAPVPATAVSDPPVVDGLGVGGGTIQARIGEDTAAIARGGIPWVFYGADPEYGYRLRLAKVGTTPTYRTLDGAGGPGGATTDSVATDLSATNYGGEPHVFYRDDTAGTLRHAWRSRGGWHVEVLDGDSTLDGRTTHDVGSGSTAAIFRGRLYVVYRDDTSLDLRVASFDGNAWTFRTLDGDADVGGRTTATVDAGFGAAVWDGALRVLYTTSPTSGAPALREVALDEAAEASYTVITPATGAGSGVVSVLRVDGALVFVAFGSFGWGWWDGPSWSLGSSDFSPHSLFVDGGSVFLAGRVRDCYGSGGCDDGLVVEPWTGSEFPDVGSGASTFWCCHSPGRASGVVTIHDRAHLFIGGAPYVSELFLLDLVLREAVGPF
jgi:hypothetical protein